jgi:tetratricopeptide (TPR) repeat protein
VYERALAIEPNDPAMLVNAGVAYANLVRASHGPLPCLTPGQGNHDAAQALYERAVAAGPAVPEAFYNLGRCALSCSGACARLTAAPHSLLQRQRRDPLAAIPLLQEAVRLKEVRPPPHAGSRG